MRNCVLLTFVLLASAGAFAGLLSVTPGDPGVDPVFNRDPGDAQHDIVLDPNTASWDALGDSSNVVLAYDLATAIGLPAGTSLTMTGVGWNLDATSIGASFLSEMSVYFDDNVAPDLSGLFLHPGGGDDVSGSANYGSTGVVDLTENGIPNIALPDGVLRIEFYEGYDDYPDDIDGLWTSGTLTIAATPEPSSLMLLGLSGLLLRRR